MNALGRHLLLELKDCNPEVLNDLEFLKSSLTETAVQIGATVIGDSFHQFSPQGVSGVVIISESHLFIHTWPEYSYAAVDVFTCGEKVDPMLAVKPLVEKLGSKSSSVIELKRGILQDIELAVS
ncbi:MAG: S-adenosylmethionine decarboxylase proenzyme [Chloroflexi bacterium]|nr:S-adenosylmethionine decarboxylase proenzyme [Chloroflexota bacterium]MBM3153861.1 S-adenosylmethionine decarboxylase proenzyme [Chloroflexota bacterium]MBM3165850.1 S-adenosylmethionine decarboxylase proenzyme [Chloroflexota bacterium]MBM3173136.1 S-adenosylmethionine decarboxylase proenzyme [Chloroflexota bacterium]MBM4449288.1 S-adenosylmethionine decarboxylase proenzyme [Chloroflexota bacterium]